MSCIKYLALCPCPDCKVLKSRIYLLGSKSDMHARQRLLRTDSNDRRRRIELARRLIFERGVNVTSKRIEEILGSESLVPIRVRTFQAIVTWALLTCTHRMPFLKDYLSMALISIALWFPICYTNSNLVFGRRSLPIYSGFCMPMEMTQYRN